MFEAHKYFAIAFRCDFFYAISVLDNKKTTGAFSLSVVFYGGPDWIRTNDLCLRRATFYPAELRVHTRVLYQGGIFLSSGLFYGAEDVGHKVAVAQYGIGFFDVLFDKDMGPGDFFAPGIIDDVAYGIFLRMGRRHGHELKLAGDLFPFFYIADEIFFHIDGALPRAGVFQRQKAQVLRLVGEDGVAMGHGFFRQAQGSGVAIHVVFRAHVDADKAGVQVLAFRRAQARGDKATARGAGIAGL